MSAEYVIIHNKQRVTYRANFHECETTYNSSYSIRTDNIPKDVIEYDEAQPNRNLGKVSDLSQSHPMVCEDIVSVASANLEGTKTHIYSEYWRFR